MKTLRRSLNSNKEHHHNISAPVPVPQLQKPASAVAPPKKVIKAREPFKSTTPQELSFSKGDFFYVTKDPEPDDEWYHVHNPVTGARGVVPRAMFEEFDKSNAVSRALGRAGSQSSVSTSSTKAKSAWYAVVLHDFTPERPDELDAKAGDPITVVAQSNREWFVAKPIGRLGRPGLIPVSFVEVRDPVTNEPIGDIEALMDRGELPRVEDWKRSVMNYKASTIPLGVLEDDKNATVPNSPFMPTTPTVHSSATHSPSLASSSPTLSASVLPMASSQPPYPSSPDPSQDTLPGPLPGGKLVSAAVVSFHYEAEEWWFRVNAVFQPADSSGPGLTLTPARRLVLYRVYNDFYDFQVELLRLFPREAGREPPHPRILPYMPGPVEQVTRDITNTRRGELDEYLSLLCDLDKYEAGYILEHKHVLDFISPKPGDLDTSYDDAPMEANLATPQLEQARYYPNDANDYGANPNSEEEVNGEPEDLDPLADDDYGDEAAENMEQQGSDDSQYYEDRFRDTSQRDPAHESFTSNSQYYPPSPLVESRETGPEATYSHHHSRPSQTLSLASAFESSPRLDSSPYPATPASAGARSHNSVSNSNAPPISASNSATAFIKIKIYDRLSDDLIAIRVSPRVTHAQLLEKVKARLGADIHELKYRDSLQTGFVNIEDDQGLQTWLGSTDKHVLYAD